MAVGTSIIIIQQVVINLSIYLDKCENNAGIAEINDEVVLFLSNYTAS